MNEKRKRVVLSLSDKVEIISQLSDGKSGAKLAKEYGVGSSTIFDIKKNSGTILKFASESSECGNKFRKTMKTAVNTELDRAVYDWYAERVSRGETVIGPQLCRKAIELNALMKGNPGFKASTGWLQRFKIRHGICEPPSNSGSQLLFETVYCENKHLRNAPDTPDSSQKQQSSFSYQQQSLSTDKEPRFDSVIIKEEQNTDDYGSKSDDYYDDDSYYHDDQHKIESPSTSGLEGHFLDESSSGERNNRKAESPLLMGKFVSPVIGTEITITRKEKRKPVAEDEGEEKRPKVHDDSDSRQATPCEDRIDIFGKFVMTQMRMITDRVLLMKLEHTIQNAIIDAQLKQLQIDEDRKKNEDK